MPMTSGTQTTTGWIVFIAGLGMMFGMMAVDIASLKEWSEMTTPVFVGTALGHLAAVITSFIGGKIIPEQRTSDRTRVDDV
jgi:hypothetical protein